MAATGAFASATPAPQTPSPQQRPVVKLGLAGDTMLGRCVAEVIFQARQPNAPPDSEREALPFYHKAARMQQQTAGAPSATGLFEPGVLNVIHEADLMFLNLECCISTSTQRWPSPHKPFFFRAPPVAVEDLKALGVDAVTLANNHALDYCQPGLLDTLQHLKLARIGVTGAGRNVDEARQPIILQHPATGIRIGVIGFTDHPAEFAATSNRPGVAYVDLEGARGGGLPQWVGETIHRLKEEEQCDVVLVSPHWGPNMNVTPLPYVQQAAAQLRALGADVIAGHSAHCFQGAWAGGHVLYDMGDFIDDYAVDPAARNDLGLFFLLCIDVETRKPVRVEALPLKLDFCLTRRATGADHDFIVRRFKAQSAKFGTVVHEAPDGRLYFDLP